MLKILFFASIRERLGCRELALPLAEAGGDLDALQAHLVASRGAPWGEVLGQDNLVRAVNQRVVDGNCALAEGDEVAFFPPVTGG